MSTKRSAVSSPDSTPASRMARTGGVSSVSRNLFLESTPSQTKSPNSYNPTIDDSDDKDLDRVITNTENNQKRAKDIYNEATKMLSQTLANNESVKQLVTDGITRLEGAKEKASKARQELDDAEQQIKRFKKEIQEHEIDWIVMKMNIEADDAWEECVNHLDINLKKAFEGVWIGIKAKNNAKRDIKEVEEEYEKAYKNIEEGLEFIKKAEEEMGQWKLKRDDVQDELRLAFDESYLLLCKWAMKNALMGIENNTQRNKNKEEEEKVSTLEEEIKKRKVTKSALEEEIKKLKDNTSELGEKKSRV